MERYSGNSPFAQQQEPKKTACDIAMDKKKQEYIKAKKLDEWEGGEKNEWECVDGKVQLINRPMEDSTTYDETPLNNNGEIRTIDLSSVPGWNPKTGKVHHDAVIHHAGPRISNVLSVASSMFKGSTGGNRPPNELQKPELDKDKIANYKYKTK